MSQMNNISLYIPRVFPNFDKDYVAKAFKNIGDVSQIDFVAKQDRAGKDYNAVYIHFNKWYTNKKAKTFYDSVVDDTKEARLCHDDPWYWIVLPNTAKKYVPGDRKPTIDLGDSTVISTTVMSSTVMPSTAPVNVPQKRTYANAAEKPVSQAPAESSEANFDEVAEFEAQIEAEMDEIEEFLEAEDENLVRIDGRYVQQIESENLAMNLEIMQLRSALINLDQKYQAEAAKVRAFSNNVVSNM